MGSKRYRGGKPIGGREVVMLATSLTILAAACYAAEQAPVAAEPEPPVMELVIVEPTTEETLAVDPIQEEAVEPVYIYDVPMDADLQMHIIETCKTYHIEPAVVVAMVERESSFRADVIGDSGKSYGLMQIQERYHRERMERLGVSDLLNPYQNVLVGIDYLAELCERYECIGMALVAYNAGPGGAKTHYWDKGIYESKYSTGVLARSEELTEGMTEYVLLD